MKLLTVLYAAMLSFLLIAEIFLLNEYLDFKAEDHSGNAVEQIERLQFQEKKSIDTADQRSDVLLGTDIK